MQADCPNTLKKLIPLSKVVNGAILDMYGDAGKDQQLAFYFAASEFKLMQEQTLKNGIRHALITVNQNTRTASLPPDFDEETFVGYIKHGKKVPIPLHTNLINTNSITTIECEDTCAKCGQDSTICNDLTVTETTEVVVVGDTTATKTVIKKLYPDGGYYLETTYPYWNVEDSVVAYATTKEFIAAIDLLDCGCINPTLENIETIRTCCYDAYCCHYTECSSVCDTNAGGYKIFEQQGLIQFDYNFARKHTQVYIEYRGFIPKLNGQLAVPAVAETALREATKFRMIEGKINIPNSVKDFRLSRKNIARKAMIKVMARLSIDDIIYAVSLTPKFDWTAPAWNDYCPVTTDTVTIDNSNVCDSSVIACSSTPRLTPFQIAVIVPASEAPGLPIPGLTYYQHDSLIGAVNLEYIIVNNANESKLLSQFTFNNVTGTIDRDPNVWFEGDVLIVNFNKMV